MDFEIQRKKRMEDLEIKRKRLEEMKKMRSERLTAADASSEETSKPAPAPVAISNIPPPNKNADLDELVSSLLSTPVETKSDSYDNNVKMDTPVVAPIVIEKPKPILETFKRVATFSIAAIRTEKYDKDIQTDAFLFEYDKSNNEEEDELQEEHHRRRSESVTKKSPTKIPPDNNNNNNNEEKNEKSIATDTIKEYSTDDKIHIYSSSHFKTFLSTTTRIVERDLAIASSIDILQDFKGDRSSSSRDDQVQNMSNIRKFKQSAIEGRPVMDMQFSPHHSELFLVAYGSVSSKLSDNDSNNDSAPTSSSITSLSQIADKSVSTPESSGGLLVLWSVLIDSTPEFFFTAPSPVLTAKFHPDDPHLIIGACYSGQIVLWDTRSSTPKPVQMSSNTGKGHKHPVYALSISKSTVKSSIFISASTDGTFCHWDSDNLTEPLSVVSLVAPSNLSALHRNNDSSLSKDTKVALSQLTSKTQRKDIPVYASCIALGPDEDSRKVILGSECGVLYRLTLPFMENGVIDQVCMYIVSMYVCRMYYSEL
jgi:dynein intermediate chain